MSYNEPGAWQSVNKSGKLAHMNPTICCDLDSFKAGQEADVSSNNLAC